MRLRIDKQKVEALMQQGDFNASSLIVASGLSRQGFYDMFKADYQPVARGVVALAGVLGVNPLELLAGVDERATELRTLLQQSENGDARSFEVLPAVLRASDLAEASRVALTTTQRRLLSAASQIAFAISRQSTFRSLADTCMPDDGSAFFFGRRYMSAEQIISRTPRPMKERGVYGAFDLGDFRRHMA